MRVKSDTVEPFESVLEVIIGSGCTVSTVKVHVFDTMFELFETSVAVPAATDTTTVPSDEPRTTSKVYVAPEPAKLLAAGEPPFAEPVTVISPIAKLLTDSENVTV